jgi:hypothetical protein
VKLFVSSYALASPQTPWDRTQEAALFDGLAEMGLAGLELPFTGRLHAHDEDWLVTRLKHDWKFIVSLLPGTMEHLQRDERFGLASTALEGRLAAMNFADEARRAVGRLNEALGRPAVAAVNIHSAPRAGAGSSAAAFSASLTELRGRDWFGAELLVEHCDTVVRGFAPNKGFLSLADDLASTALSRGKTPIRIILNWGRSALESRSERAPAEHIALAKKSKLLAGVFFSGITADDDLYGAWRDTHAPFSTSRPSSLLTPAAARGALKLAGELSYVGLKIQPLPKTLATSQRLAMIRDGMNALA